MSIRRSDHRGSHTDHILPAYAKRMLSRVSGVWDERQPQKEIKCIRGKEHKKPNKKGECPECGDQLLPVLLGGEGWISDGAGSGGVS